MTDGGRRGDPFGPLDILTLALLLRLPENGPVNIAQLH